MPASTDQVWLHAVLPTDWAPDIIENIAHPIFIKDRQFRFVVLNEAFARMAGFERREMLGKTDFDFFPRAEAEFFRRKDEEMFRGGVTVHIPEEPITDRAGLKRVLATTKVPLHGPSGEVTHLIGITSDITELKSAQAQLEQSNRALEQRVQARTDELQAAHEELLRAERLAVLGRLAGGIAHQIRNPLGSILNAAALLRHAMNDARPDRFEEAVRIIEEEAWSANRIITGLIERGRVKTGLRGRHAVSALVQQALQSWQPPEAVQVLLQVGDHEVDVDPAQVASALSNLIQNACEAMPSGGQLKLRSSADASRVTLFIADSGSGVASEVLAQLFQPLVTSKPLGLGLGLTTARMLIERQGGRLELGRATPGAEFQVTLPLAA